MAGQGCPAKMRIKHSSLYGAWRSWIIFSGTYCTHVLTPSAEQASEHSLLSTPNPFFHQLTTPEYWSVPPSCGLNSACSSWLVCSRHFCSFDCMIFINTFLMIERMLMPWWFLHSQISHLGLAPWWIFTSCVPTTRCMLGRMWTYISISPPALIIFTVT